MTDYKDMRASILPNSVQVKEVGAKEAKWCDLGLSSINAKEEEQWDP